MNSESSPDKAPRFGLFRNWLSLAGIVLALGSLFSFLLLFLIDSLAHFSNPYIGVLTYLVAPSFLALGTALSIVGIIWRRWREKRTGGLIPAFQIDLGRRRDRRLLGVFLAGSALFLLISSVLSYHTYHYTESVQFCGQACHTVMKPELVTYSHGPHRS